MTIDQMAMPNQVTGANSRPASPFNSPGFIVSLLCAPPFLSAAVAQFGRWGCHHMHAGKNVIVWLLGLCTVIGSDAEWHTSPDQWSEPRVFHCPFDEQFASRISLDRCAAPTRLPERHMSANKAYWFATILPDRTKGGPWNTDVLVFTERDYLLRIRLRDIHYCRDIGWVNEKLVRIRVWWGRICATDLIVDVEQERIIYREMVWDGGIAFQQFQEAKKNPQPAGPANGSQPIRSATNSTPSAAGSRR
jgi:hypothetical protein